MNNSIELEPNLAGGSVELDISREYVTRNAISQGASRKMSVQLKNFVEKKNPLYDGGRTYKYTDFAKIMVSENVSHKMKKIIFRGQPPKRKKKASLEYA